MKKPTFIFRILMSPDRIPLTQGANVAFLILDRNQLEDVRNPYSLSQVMLDGY
jgi:hypothetical protein